MGSLSGKRILIVEDEALIAAMAEDMLTEEDAIVLGPVTTIEAGISFASTEAIDAAVLDMNICGRLVDPVFAILETRNIPVVFATGYGQTAAIRSTGARIIEKPYTQEKLVHALQQALRCLRTGCLQKH